MTVPKFAARLANLGAGETLAVEKGECDRLFAPGLQSAAGRQHMYAVANQSGCDVRWHSFTIHFTRR